MVEVRKIQQQRPKCSCLLVIPKQFLDQLELEKGDYVKMDVYKDTLLVQKVEM
jgi:antitoxin component of MazEF toxin-antitoxin module